MTPSLSDMFRRIFNAQGQSCAARSVETFGWLNMLGSIILVAPYWTALLPQSSALAVQSLSYLRLVGLSVGGLGMQYVVAGRLNAQGFVFASLRDRPLVPAIRAVLWYKQILPGPLALAFSACDFGGFLWAFSAWRQDAESGPGPRAPRLVSRIAAGSFAFGLHSKADSCLVTRVRPRVCLDCPEEIARARAGPLTAPGSAHSSFRFHSEQPGFHYNNQRAS
jgi:hypothetical protein